MKTTCGVPPCSTCLAFGLHSPAVAGWPYAPLCREHVADAVLADSGEPDIAPPPGGFPPTSLLLQ